MALPKTYEPPKWIYRILSWFCKEELLEEIEGDLFQYYQQQREKEPSWRAKLNYTFHALNFLRPFALKRIGQHSNTTIMYRSYMKTGFRNLKRQKLSSFINVFGLATTIAIALVVYVLVNREYSLDKFHADAERVFAIQSQIDWNGREETWGKGPLMVGSSLISEIPQVEKMARVDRKSAIVKFNENVFNERLTFADPEYLEIFSFEIEKGDKSVLRDKSQVIISQSNAEKYFNGENAIGKEIKVIINDEPLLFQVGAVAAPFPKNASFRFDFLLPFQNLETIYGYDFTSWDELKNNGVYTFIKLDKAESIDPVMSALDGYKALVNEQNSDWPILGFSQHPLTSLARNAQFIRDAYASGSTPQIMIMFAIVSLLLLVSAIFNYVNISISMAQKRFGEIAVRKVIGGQRKQLVAQFMIENLILCFIATIAGFFLAKYFMLPGINSLFQGSDYQIDILENTWLIGFMAILFVLTGITSGAYPALYVSGFKPISILGGRETTNAKNRLTRVFLFFQFFLTFFAVISGFLFTGLNEFQSEREWGYEPENLLVVGVNNLNEYQQLSQFAQSAPKITAWEGSTNQVGLSFIQKTVKLDDNKLVVRSFAVGPGYLDLLGFDLKAGRKFQKDLKSDEIASIVVNEDFLKKFGIQDSWDSSPVEIDDQNFNIVGVVKDFHFDDFFNPITPVIFQVDPEEKYNYVTLKTEGLNIDETEELVKQYWSGAFPDTPFVSFAQAGVFDNFFESSDWLSSIMNFVAIVAIILSSMGLFGLVSLIIMKKLKEYSIRKVLGAPSAHILKLVSKQFIILMGLAVVIGIPLSYGLFDTLFQQVFPGSLDTISIKPFILTVLILLGVILATVSMHIIQLLRLNPVNSLRME